MFLHFQKNKLKFHFFFKRFLKSVEYIQIISVILGWVSPFDHDNDPNTCPLAQLERVEHRYVQAPSIDIGQ